MRIFLPARCSVFCKSTVQKRIQPQEACRTCLTADLLSGIAAAGYFIMKRWRWIIDGI